MLNVINLLALLLSITGTFMMFYYSPVINSQVFLYRKSELENIKKSDAYKNKMLRFGLILIFISCLLQAIAIFFNVTAN